MSIGLERLEKRAVLTAAFDVAGITSLRNDLLFSQIDGQGPDGRKIGVAILDSGVYGNHPDLRSNFVAYYDAVTRSAPTTNPAASRDPEGQGGHGTHVSGTAASSNPAYGVATRGGLIGVRVFPGQGERAPAHDALIEGLRWVSQVYQQYNIKVVNLSLGWLYGDFSNNFNSSTPPGGSSNASIAAAIRNLERLGITVVTSAGNSWAQFQQEGSGFPGNVSTVSVVNTWATSFTASSPQDAVVKGQWGATRTDNFGSVELRTVPDQLAASSQRSGSLSSQVAAPGQNIVSTSYKGGTESMSGTSMASPLVAGVVALMQDAAQTFGGRWLTPAEVHSLLRSSADTIVDTPTSGNGRFPVTALADRFLSSSEVLPLAETGKSFLRINAHRAVQAVRTLLGGGSAPVTGQDLNGTMATAVTVPDLDGTRVFQAFGSIGRDGNTAVGSNDVDLVKIQLASPGSISIRVDPDPNGRSFDPYLRLFNASGQQIAAANNTNGNYPALQSVTLQPGTYYAGISSFSNSAYGVVSATGRSGGGSEGDYSFTVTLENPDPNGVMQGAVPANLWASVPGGQLGYFYFFGEIGSDPPPVDGTARVPVGLGDVDMYEVVAPDSGWLQIAVYAQQGLFRQSTNPFDALLRVFDENGSLLAAADNNFNFTDPYVQMWVNRGQRLFVGVSAWFNGAYSASDPYGRPNFSGTGTYEIAHWFDTKDANGSAFAAVTTANLQGTPLSGQIGMDYGQLVGLDGTKDVDFFSYVVQQSGMLDVTVAGQPGFMPAATLWKWDPVRKNVVRIAERAGGSVNHRVAVQAGDIYYASVTGSGNVGYQWFAAASGSGGTTGSYTITGSIQESAAVWQVQDDTFQGVAITSLGGNDVRLGELGFDDTLYRGTTDVDMYRFQPQASGRVAFAASGDGAFAASPILRLFDAQGGELAFSMSSLDGRKGSTLAYDVAAGQTYYVGVSGWAESGDLRGYQPTGTLSTVWASTGSYVLSTSSDTTASPSRPPNDIAISSATVAENQPPGTAVGSFTTTDPDAGNTFTYALIPGAGSDDNGSFTIDGDVLKTAARLDFEAKSSHSIRVKTTDQDGLSIEMVFTIAVADVPGEPLVVTAVTPPAAGTYRAGQRVSFNVAFSAAVRVKGKPQIEVQAGTVTRAATYISGSGTAMLTFQYTVGRKDNFPAVGLGRRFVLSRANSITAGAEKLPINLPAGFAGAAAPGVRLDALSPKVSGRPEAPESRINDVGDPLNFVVRFSEAVVVSGTPRIAVTGFTGARWATYVSGSGTNTLTFRYTVQAGDALTRRKSLGLATSISLPSDASITDEAGNSADLRISRRP